MNKTEQLGQFRDQLLKSIQSIVSSKTKPIKVKKEIESFIFGDDWYAAFHFNKISSKGVTGTIEEFDFSRKETIELDAISTEALAELLDVISENG